MKFKLRYGRGWTSFTTDYFKILGILRPKRIRPPGVLSLIRSLKTPFCEFIDSAKKILFVVSDLSRYAGAEILLPGLLRMTERAGIKDRDIKILFATGLHRHHTLKEREYILGREVFSRIRCMDHDPRRKDGLFKIGKTSLGIEIRINREILLVDRVVVIGSVGFHNHAGFGGGWKNIIIGCGAQETINELHKLTIRDDALGWSRPGILHGNIFREQIDQAGRMIEKPVFAINTIISEEGKIIKSFCGEVDRAFREGVRFLLENFSIRIKSQADIVIASCGGFPRDINLIQSHKAMDYAVPVLKQGGVLILVANCEDGLGYPGFDRWFEFDSPDELKGALRRRFQVYGRTAWDLWMKAIKYKIILCSKLEEEVLWKMGLVGVKDIKKGLELARRFLPENPGCYIIPAASFILPRA